VSLREQILASSDIQSELVTIPEWGVTVEVRGMTAAARAAMLQHAAGNGGTFDLVSLYPSLVVGSTYDPESGDRVFSESDYAAISDKSGAAVERIAAAAMRLSGISEDARDELGNDLSATPSEDS
jgi:hypothetical protein